MFGRRAGQICFSKGASHHSHQIQELPIRVALVFFSIIVMGLEKGDGVAGNNLPVDGCLARGRVAATVAAWRVPSLAPKKDYHPLGW